MQSNYDGKKLAENIKREAKRQGVRLKDMLADLGLGVNTISQVAAGTSLSAKSLQGIANYLNISADALLETDYYFRSDVLLDACKNALDDSARKEAKDLLVRLMDQKITVAYHSAPEEIRSAADRLLEPYMPGKSENAPDHEGSRAG